MHFFLSFTLAQKKVCGIATHSRVVCYIKAVLYINMCNLEAIEIVLYSMVVLYIRDHGGLAFLHKSITQKPVSRQLGNIG